MSEELYRRVRRDFKKSLNEFLTPELLGIELSPQRQAEVTAAIMKAIPKVFASLVTKYEKENDCAGLYFLNLVAENLLNDNSPEVLH